uniref:uncharacterized protein LOC123993470 n=1 Tax=Oncorhynchus gorbuscha TaxID=8017 RepID=UPI001EAF5759|nr:uncharacterized protein LOC123993470 [Oncorhynchus gorbuscha]
MLTHSFYNESVEHNGPNKLCKLNRNNTGCLIKGVAVCREAFIHVYSRKCLTNPPVIQSSKRELAQARKGSSAVINYMHHFFTNYGVGKTRVDLKCDNFSGQNKNRLVLWYCAWWNMCKLHHNLDFHFLITGHTKFATDLCFNLIKQRFRQTRVNTLSDIAGVVKDSTVTGQYPRAGWTGGWYGAGGKLWLATTPDSVLQAAGTEQAVPALQL